MSLLTGLPTPRTLHGSPSMLLPLFPPTLCSTEYPQLGVHNPFTTHFSFCGGGWCEGQEGVEYRKLQLPARPPTLLQVIPFLWASVKMRQNEVMPGEGATGSRSGITCWQADRSLSPGTVVCDPREVASLLPPPAAPEIRVRLAPFSHQCSALNPGGKEDGVPVPYILFTGCKTLDTSFSGTQFTHPKNRDNNGSKESRKLFVIQRLLYK